MKINKLKKMNIPMKSQLIDKQTIGKKLGEFINDSQSNVDNKIKIIFKLIASIKEENDQIISKSK